MRYQDVYNELHRIERKRIAPTPAHVLRLHRLERPVDWPEQLQEQMRRAIANVQQYPDYQQFIDRLRRHTHPLHNVVLGLGIEGLMRDLFTLYVRKGDGVAYTWPTCAMFDVYCEVFGATPHRIIVDPDKPFSVYDVTNALRNNTKMLLLPNPGQPVDVCFDHEQVAFIARECERNGTILVLDEAYYGFGAPSYERNACFRSAENVVLLRTFSKMYGAAGIRIGWATGSTMICKALDAIRMSGEIAGPSMAIATVLLDNFTIVCEEARKIMDGRDWLVDRISDLGFRTRGSKANHVLINCGSEEFMQKIAMGLEARGVRVKHSYPHPLERHLLVTAGPRATMQQFYEAFSAEVMQ